MENISKQVSYQYKDREGHMFNTKADKEAYQELQMEQKQLQQEEQYRDNMDKTPSWLFPSENGGWEC